MEIGCIKTNLWFEDDLKHLTKNIIRHRIYMSYDGFNLIFVDKS
jgi:hypothetical protein